MSTADTSPGCETHDMVVVHRVFRRELALLPRMVRAVAPGDLAQAGVVVAHAQEMTSMLHHHHTAEDELVWPRLRDRARLDPVLLERMESQHHVVGELLDELDVALPRFGQTADPARGAALASVLDRVSAALDEHLDEEETAILPVVARTLTVAEWEELARRGMSAMSKARLLVILGHILEEADDDERAAFLQHVPLPARVAYRLVGRRRYLRETAAQRRGLG
jgi:hemerythrin-like domain-containing protein